MNALAASKTDHLSKFNLQIELFKVRKNNNVFNKIMMFKIAALLSKIWQFSKDIIDSKYSL